MTYACRVVKRLVLVGVIVVVLVGASTAGSAAVTIRVGVAPFEAETEIGEKGAIKITDEEVNQALMERVQQFPGQEREVYEFYQKNPEALAELRVPIFENKVVDHILEKASVKDKKVSTEELFKDPDGDDES